MRLFELTGGWVRGVPELDVKLRLHTDSHHHAWHAELWQQRRGGRGPGGADLTAPPEDGTAEVLEALAALGDGATTLEKLVGLYRVVLPHRIAVCRRHRETTSAVRDGPAIRALDLVLGDEEEDWRRGELLVQSLLHGPEEVQAAAAHQARHESLLAGRAGSAP